MSKVIDKFLRKKRAARNNISKCASAFELHNQELIHYAEHGKVNRELPLQRKDLPYLPWALLKSEMSTSQTFCELHAEATFIEEGSIARGWLIKTVKYGLLGGAINLFCYQRAANLLGKEATGLIRPDDTFNICIAVILGDYDNADNIFIYLSEAYNRGWINRSKSHLTDFMLLLFARYKTERLSCAVNDFAYQHIVDDWDTADPDKIINYITLLCDEQVMQVAAPPSKCFFEFNNMNWQFIPYPALMLLALRKARGIDTPDIEHPAFGKLNDIPLVDGEDVHDEVFEQLTAKLQQQGFDMNAIFS